jgi:hypothetical protein
MLLFELFTPTAPNLLLEGIDHPEDLIISQGTAGARRVVKELSGLSKSTETVTVKWDGFPALVFGRDKSGALVFMDKHMYDKVAKGKMDFISIRAYDEDRGATRASLWSAEDALRPLLEDVVPSVKDQYYMGDLMWVGTPTIKDGYYIFKPNTVEYRVKIDATPDRGNSLGDKIARSAGGIAIHTFISGLGNGDQPLVGMKGLNENGGITFLVGEMSDKPKVSVNKTLLKNTNDVINSNEAAVEKFIKEITDMKGKAVITAMGPFITRMLEEDNIQSDIVPRFLDFLKERLNEAAQAKFIGANNDGWLYQDSGGAPGLLGIWQMWAAVTDLKIHIKQQIDSQQGGSEVIAITNGASAHEGYVFGAGKDKLKLIDRLGFSAANFARHKVPDEEVAAKSKMPMASFCFGRMNPPTLGHKLVMETTVATGGANSYIFLSNSVGKDDPLDPAIKTAFIKKMYPQYAKNIVTDYVEGPIYAANWLYDKGFRHMTFIGGSDRLGKSKGSIEKLLNSWNSGPVRTTDNARGDQGRDHVVLKFVSSGERDPESAGVSGYSGSKARAAAEAGDERLFQQFTGVKNNIVVDGKTLYQAVREGLGIKDAAPAAAPAAAPSPAAANPNATINEWLIPYNLSARLVEHTNMLSEEEKKEQGYKILTALAWALGKGAQGIFWVITHPFQAVTLAATLTHPQGAWNLANLTWNLIADPSAVAGILAGQLTPWGDKKKAADDLSSITGGKLPIEAIQGLATIAVQYALPVAGVIALLYGGKKLYDYLESKDKLPEPKEKQEPVPVKEQLMPANTFAGSKKNKLGVAGQWRNKGPKANKPAKAGDLVGGN